MRQHKKLIALVSAALFLFVGSLASASETTAWFGVKPPPRLSDPHKPVVDVSKVKPPAAVIPADDPKAPELNGARIYQDVKTIVGFSRKDYDAGNKAWGRVTGFPAAKATIEWHAAQFKKAGLQDVQVQEYDAAPNTTMWNATQ